MSAFLPRYEGWLPYWLLLVRDPMGKWRLFQTNDAQISAVSIGNTVQAYITIANTQQVYAQSGRETTALSSRLFGTWTFVSSIVRLYAAYNISNPQVYQLALWTYGIAWSHFMSEWLVFRTAAWGKGFAGPAVVSTVTLLWMLGAWDSYVP